MLPPNWNSLLCRWWTDSFFLHWIRRTTFLLIYAGLSIQEAALFHRTSALTTWKLIIGHNSIPVPVATAVWPWRAQVWNILG